MNKPRGLTQKNGIWHINKVINGVRICQSTRTSDYDEAVAILRKVESTKRSFFASEEWSDKVANMPTGCTSWIGKTIQRINKPSVVASKGKPGITAETLKLILLRSNGVCEVTGIKFSDAIPEGCRTAPYAMSIDRVDSSKGYTLANCRVVCFSVNVAMNEWGEDVLLRIGKAVMLRHLAKDMDLLANIDVPRGVIEEKSLSS